MPPQLEGLVDKTWLFKIEAKANHNPRFEQSYRVRKICTDAAIIQLFNEKWDKEEAAVRKSQNVCQCFHLNRFKYVIITKISETILTNLYFNFCRSVDL
jgi:hypothetical protein